MKLMMTAAATILVVKAAIGQTAPASAPATVATATAPPAVTMPATVPANVVKLEALIARLSDDDWRTRESATKEIVTLGLPAKSRLEKLVAETKG